jgi:hypothetical protein
VVNQANQRLAFLTSESGKAFYSWFSKLDPKPDAPIELPSDLTLPPMMPDLQFGPSDAGPSNLPNDQAELDPGALPALPSGDILVPTGPASSPLELSPPTEQPAPPTSEAAPAETPLPATEAEVAPVPTPASGTP